MANFRIFQTFFCVVSVFFWGGIAFPATSAAQELKRIGIVFGAKDYDQISSLFNTENDANDIGKLLDEKAFETHVRINPTIDIVDQALEKLAESAQAARDNGATVDVVFYFGGHGASYRGENYLLPVDFPSSGLTNKTFSRKALSVTGLLNDLQVIADRVVIILDACRDNPFKDVVFADKSIVNSGFSQFPPVGFGTLIYYCAGFGQVAKDFLPLDDPTKRNNGVCTRFLLEELTTSDDDFASIAQRVSLKVYDATKLAGITPPQTPGLYIQMIGPFYMQERDKDKDIAVASREIEIAVRKLTASEQESFGSRSFEASSAEIFQASGASELLPSIDKTNHLSDDLAGLSMNVYFRPDRLADAQYFQRILGDIGARVNIISTDLSEVTQYPVGTNRLVRLVDMNSLDLEYYRRVQALLSENEEASNEIVETRLRQLENGPFQIQLF